MSETEKKQKHELAIGLHTNLRARLKKDGDGWVSVPCVEDVGQLLTSLLLAANMFKILRRLTVPLRG